MDTPGVHEIPPSQMDLVAESARREGYAVFVLSVSRLDRAGFFDAVKSTLPLDPPLVGHRSWDALADSLWEGIHALASTDVFILWRGAAAYNAAAPSEFHTATSVLYDVAASLADSTVTAGRPKRVYIYIEQVSSWDRGDGGVGPPE